MRSWDSCVRQDTFLYSLDACDEPLAWQCASGENHKAAQVRQLWRLVWSGSKLAHALQVCAGAVEQHTCADEQMCSACAGVGDIQHKQFKCTHTSTCIMPGAGAFKGCSIMICRHCGFGPTCPPNARLSHSSSSSCPGCKPFACLTLVGAAGRCRLRFCDRRGDGCVAAATTAALYALRWRRPVILRDAIRVLSRVPPWGLARQTSAHCSSSWTSRDWCVRKVPRGGAAAAHIRCYLKQHTC